MFADKELHCFAANCNVHSNYQKSPLTYSSDVPHSDWSTPLFAHPCSHSVQNIIHQSRQALRQKMNPSSWGVAGSSVMLDMKAEVMHILAPYFLSPISVSRQMPHKTPLCVCHNLNRKPCLPAPGACCSCCHTAICWSTYVRRPPNIHTKAPRWISTPSRSVRLWLLLTDERSLNTTGSGLQHVSALIKCLWYTLQTGRQPEGHVENLRRNVPTWFWIRLRFVQESSQAVCMGQMIIWCVYVCVTSNT